jgi:hypothetical protein
MYMTFLRLLLISLGFYLAACSGIGWEAMTATPHPATPTPLLTPTPVWFPATSTPSPQPFSTQAATPERLVGLSGAIAIDDFSNPTLWDTYQSDQGSATISRQRLTLSVQPGVYRISLNRNLIVGDFYAELTARPSLCRAADEYGLLVRAIPITYYRFALTCNGMIHAERISVKERHVLHEAVPSGDAPPGAPGEVRIGVWAAGPELRLFLNGRYQFSIIDLNLASGTVGVFAHAVGDTPVTVTYSDLVVEAVEYTPPAETPTP